jgi:cold shock CspA family protein
MSARYSGVLTAWVAAENFGEITPSDSSLAALPVRREALRQGGIEAPAVGQRLTFELGTEGAVSAAVNLAPEAA